MASVAVIGDHQPERLEAASENGDARVVLSKPVKPQIGREALGTTAQLTETLRAVSYRPAICRSAETAWHAACCGTASGNATTAFVWFTGPDRSSCNVDFRPRAGTGRTGLLDRPATLWPNVPESAHAVLAGIIECAITRTEIQAQACTRLERPSRSCSGAVPWSGSPMTSTTTSA